jgi:hypothetical protein
MSPAAIESAYYRDVNAPVRSMANGLAEAFRAEDEFGEGFWPPRGRWRCVPDS